MARILVVEGDQRRVINHSDFSQEVHLQTTLEKHPELLSLGDLGVRKPLFIIGREVTTEAGSIDLLCMDANAVPIIIETKLARNREIRRTVIGQVLEYVAQLSKWSPHDLIDVANAYLRKTERHQAGRSETLLDLLNSERSEETILAPEDLYQMIGANLSTGALKVVIAVDDLPDTLKDTVTFINSFSRFDIYVLQIQAYKEGQRHIYVPSIFGFARKVSGVGSPERHQWTEESFMTLIETLSDEEVEIIQHLYDFSQLNANEVIWGTGGTAASFSYRVNGRARKVNIFAVIRATNSGRISLNFGPLLKASIPRNELLTILGIVNKSLGSRLGEEVVDENKFPSVPVTCLSDPTQLEAFKQEVLRLQALLR